MKRTFKGKKGINLGGLGKTEVNVLQQNFRHQIMNKMKMSRDHICCCCCCCCSSRRPLLTVDNVCRTEWHFRKRTENEFCPLQNGTERIKSPLSKYLHGRITNRRNIRNEEMEEQTDRKTNQNLLLKEVI